MNGRPPVGIGEEAKGVDIAAPVHERPRQTHGREPRIGTKISIRVATPSDSEKLRAMFSRTSPETIYRRFHLPYPEVLEWMVALMLGVDHHKEAIVAFTEVKVVGHAMYVRLADGTEAEIAIIVEDGWQSKGVGKSLLSELVRRARPRGVATFTERYSRRTGPCWVSPQCSPGLSTRWRTVCAAFACHCRGAIRHHIPCEPIVGLHKDRITTHDKHARQTREDRLEAM